MLFLIFINTMTQNVLTPNYIYLYIYNYLVMFFNSIHCFSLSTTAAAFFKIYAKSWNDESNILINYMYM